MAAPSITLSWRRRGGRGGRVSGIARIIGRDISRIGVLILKGSQRSRDKSQDPPAAETISVTRMRAPTK